MFMSETDEALRRRLHSMWTPEMFDRFEADLWELFKGADPEFLARTTEAEREKMILEMKQRAIEKHRQLTQLLAP
jgi:hypothetical protein